MKVETLPINDIVKQATLRHYDDMIEWVEKQNQDDKVDCTDMSNDLGENWFGDCCPYCKLQSHKCRGCALHAPEENQDFGCCGQLWKKMNRTKTWKTWINAAKNVRKYIEVHG